MPQHGPFAGHRDDRPFPGILAAAVAQLLAPAFDRPVGRLDPQEPVRALRQQPASVGVAGFANAQLWIPLAGLAALGPQSPLTTYLPATGKALRAGEGQHKRKSRDRTDSERTPQRSKIGILLGRHNAYWFFIVLDLLGELGNLLDPGQERGPHLTGQLLAAARGKAIRV